MNNGIALHLNLVLPDRNGCAALVEDRQRLKSIRGMRT
jgi:hypothetical protein